VKCVRLEHAEGAEVHLGNADDTAHAIILRQVCYRTHLDQRVQQINAQLLHADR